MANIFIMNFTRLVKLQIDSENSDGPSTLRSPGPTILQFTPVTSGAPTQALLVRPSVGSSGQKATYITLLKQPDASSTPVNVDVREENKLDNKKVLHWLRFNHKTGINFSRTESCRTMSPSP